MKLNIDVEMFSFVTLIKDILKITFLRTTSHYTSAKLSPKKGPSESSTSVS